MAVGKIILRMDTNMTSKHKIHLHVEYEHQWLHKPLDLIFKVDDRVINVDVTGKNKVTIDRIISLQGSEHKFLLCCENKTHDHTRINDMGKVTKDSYAKFNKFAIDDIDLMQYVRSYGYFIGHNGEKISPSEGLWANGAWCMDFKTPVYDWLLETLF